MRHVRNQLEASYTILALTGGALGLHPCPERALSDGAQSLTLDEFARLMKGLSAPIRPVAAAMATVNGR